MVYLGPLDDTSSLGDECKFMNEWQDSYAISFSFETKVVNRIAYIINVIYSEFGIKFNGDWELVNFDDDCYECGGGKVDVYDHLSEIFTDSSIQYIKINTCPSDFTTRLINAKVMIDNKVINIAEQFPKKWVFKSFEQDLKNYKQAYTDFLAQKEINKINKRIEKITNKDKKILLQEALKAKLTAEELELISFKKR